MLIRRILLILILLTLSYTTYASTTTPTYQTLAIQTPATDETIRNNGDFMVKIRIQPTLAVTDTLQLVIDGRVVATSKRDFNFRVPRLDRGTHTIQAQIVNQHNTLIKVSNPVTIYVHQPTMRK